MPLHDGLVRKGEKSIKEIKHERVIVVVGKRSWPRRRNFQESFAVDRDGDKAMEGS
jgi:hypothetical protein